jgi:hypothetical protein
VNFESRRFLVNKLLFAVAAALLAIPLHLRAQESPGTPSIGTWIGDWSGARPGSGGAMEMVVDVKGDTVFGQVRSTGSSGCSLEWVKLAGVVKDTKMFADYNLGGRCGKVDITYSIDQTGKIMTGSWSSQYPGYGTFRLTKQATPSATGETRVTPNATEQKQ